MSLEEININAGNWVDSAQDRNNCRALVNAALNLSVPYAMTWDMDHWRYLCAALNHQVS